MKDFVLNFLLGLVALTASGLLCYLYALGGREIFFRFGSGGAIIYFTAWLWGPGAYFIGQSLRKKGKEK